MAAQNESRDPLPVPDVAPYKTLKGDFHLHSVFSDGRVWPTVHVREAWRDGLDVIAFTEHAEYHPNAPDVRIDGNRSFEIARPLAEQLGLLLIRGVEITKPDPPAPSVLPEGSAHFNALFITDANALNTPDLMQSLRAAKAQHAFVFWDHPRYGVARAQWFRPIARAFDEGLFQGMELVNGVDFYDEAYPWIAERQLTILATSDRHDPMPPRTTGFRRPITLLFVRSADAEGVREALDTRRTAAWLGDDVWGAEEFLKGPLGRRGDGTGRGAPDTRGRADDRVSEPLGNRDADPHTAAARLATRGSGHRGHSRARRARAFGRSRV